MAHPPTKRINVLFTSVGRRVELLRAFRRAYQQLDLSGRLVVTDIDPLAPALRLADQSYMVPRVTSPDYIAALVEICHKEQIDLIFPLIDPDIPILASHSGVLEATGAKVVVVPLAAAQMTGDKYATAQFFQQLGLNTPQTWLPEQIDPAAACYPLFIKPRNGSASKFTFKINNSNEFKFFSHYVPEPVVQEYIPGPEITTDVVGSLDGEMLAIVSRQRIEVRGGEVVKGVTMYCPCIADACTKIAQALPAIGPVTVQCIMRNNEPFFTEINARFGGGAPLGVAAGVDAPQWLLAQAADIKVKIPPLGSYKVGLYLTRFDDSFFLTQSDYEQMESHRF